MALYPVTPKFLTGKQRGAYTNAELTQPSDPAVTFGEKGLVIERGPCEDVLGASNDCAVSCSGCVYLEEAH